MKIFDANISSQVANLLCNRISSIPFYDIANKKLVEEFGIKNFFSNQEEYLLLKKAISSSENEAYVIYKCPSRSGTFTITKTPGGSLQVKNGCVPAGF